MPRHLLAAVLALLLVAAPATAENGANGEHHPQLASPATGARLAVPKRPLTRAKKGRTSPFVYLAGMIAANEYVFNSFTDLGLGAFNPDIIDRVLATPDTHWAFGRLERSLPVGKRLPAAFSPSGNDTAGRSVGAKGGPSTPFFGDPFRSLPGLEPPISIGMDAGFGADPILASRNGSHGPTGGDLSAGGGNSSRVPLAYRYAMDKKTSVNAGVTWIQDLGDATGMEPSLNEPGSDGSATNRLPGVNLNLGASYKALTLTGGYIHALDNRTSTELALAGEESDPVAWSSELAYSTELLRRETTLAVGYQRSSEALHAYLPEERYRTRASVALSDSTVFSLEYYLDREDDMADNGDTDGYGITTKIGFGF
ncbi:LbtU family siderophore porin [Desulfobulbus elongatus]|uniref:LbtU family siderophore porin n=1 Tax=Desulfobulbus elongatus TaxID=53332 RepID=UPI000488F874|nr:LbtU family siderophore porin [Desulfobulbus elongatus]